MFNKKLLFIVFRFSLVILLQFIICIRTGLASEVSLVKDKKGRWGLLVDGKPYFIQGVDYRITKIGQSPDYGTLEDWAYYDFNSNRKPDGPYDAWVDKNLNNTKDLDEPIVGDFELLRQMGTNTIRWYVNDFNKQKPNKKLLRDLYKSYGIRVAVGDKFGAYTRGSGASWSVGTDYLDPKQKANMLKSVRKMVLDHKDEPYTLLWLLGNENNLPFTNTNASKYPEEYAKFLNKAAQLIHKLDSKHPVAMVNGDTKHLSCYIKFCPDIDIFGVNVYRGKNGFGGLWWELKSSWDKPILIVEFGGSFAPGIDEEYQVRYHRNCWLDIEANRDNKGTGSAIGGFAFEWLDEWWKSGKPYEHAAEGTTGKQGLGKPEWTQEYCGIASQGDGKHSPFMRQLRKVYFIYKSFWNKNNHHSVSITK